MRELDMLLDAHLARYGSTMTADEIRTFERFLDATDIDLYAWMTRRSRPRDAGFAALVDRILDVGAAAP